jgi:hypothetical protein
MTPKKPRQVDRAPGGLASRPARVPKGQDASQGILSCRLKVDLPSGTWIGAFTVAHPEVRLEILDRLEVGKGLTMVEARAISVDSTRIVDEIRGLPGVESVELIDAVEGSEEFRVLFRGKTFIPMLKRLRLVRHFPFPIQNGVAAWTVVGPEAKVRALLKSLETESGGVRVDSVRHGPLRKGLALLTPRQQEVLRRAMAEGYFDVPRRISLTELAPKIGVAISTLSVTLAVIEKKILEPHS